MTRYNSFVWFDCLLLATLLGGCAPHAVVKDEDVPISATAMHYPSVMHVSSPDEEVRITAIAVHLPEQDAVDVQVAIDLFGEPGEPAKPLAHPRVLARIDEPANVTIGSDEKSITLDIEPTMHAGQVQVDINVKIEGHTAEPIRPRLSIPAPTPEHNATTPG